jgi:Fic family protein
MNSLFKYLNESDIHSLILACVFHYYFVAIHPFSDGNGRIARFWLSLILTKYDNSFEFIPVEEEIKNNQDEYYQAIEECHINNNANQFIKYMLKVINKSLDKIISKNDIIDNYIDNRIIDLIIENDSITQDKIADILDINVRTVKRHFKSLIDNKVIQRVGSDKTGIWELL